MEEEEELRAKAIASMSISARTNTNPKTNSSLARDDDDKFRKMEKRSSSSSPHPREEGELSSGEDDAAEEPEPESDQNRIIPEVPAQSVVADPPRVEHAAAALRDKITPSASSVGKHLPVKNPAFRVNVQPPMSMMRNNNKKFEMIPVHSRSITQNPGRFPHSEADHNLVIRFSDDESASDSEECGSERPLARKDAFPGVDKDKNLANSIQPKVKTSQWPPTYQTKSMQKKVSDIRKFKPTTARSLGTNFRGPGSSFVEEARNQRNDSLYQASTIQDPKFVQGARSPETELEILRRKIALRENELKRHRKALPQQKERASGSYEDSQGMHLETNEASVNMAGLTTTEKEKKYLKPVEHSNPISNSSGQLQMLMHNVEVTSKFGEQDMATVNDKVTPLRSQPQRNYKQPCENDGQIPLSSDGYVETQQGKPSVGFSEVMLSALSKHGVPLKQVNDCVNRAEDFCKTEKCYELVDTSTLSRKSSRLMSNEDGVHEMPPLKKFRSQCMKNLNIASGAQSASLLPCNDLSRHNLVSSDQHNEIISHDGILPQHPHVFDECSNHAQESMLGASNWHPERSSCTDFQSLANMEAMHDRELEEAQEYRQKCELEERSALKAYRTAQKTLMDANERCNYLYRKRELVSAKLQTLAMENSMSLWSPRWQEENSLGSMENIPKSNLNFQPGISCHSPTEQDSMNQVVQEPNLQHDLSQLDASGQHISRHHVGPEPCSEHDTSTSEQVHLKNNSAADGVFSPSINPDLYADEDEAVESRLVCRVNVQKHKEKRTNEAFGRKSYIEAAQDSEFIEDSLRSELFAHLGMRTCKNPDLIFEDKCNSHEGADIANREIQKCMMKISTVSNHTFAEEEKSQMINIEGSKVAGSRGSQIPVHQHDHNHVDNVCSDYGSHRSTNHEESSSSLEESCRPIHTTVFSLPSSVLRILFRHLKVIFPRRCKGYPTIQDHESSHEGASEINCSMQLVVYKADLITSHTRDTSSVKTSDISIDPLWPFCMYDLRGKCNDDECSWQHARDYSKRDLKQTNDSSNCDVQGSPSSVLVNSTDRQKLPRRSSHYIVPVPTYLIGSHLIKADKQSPGGVLSRSTYPYWQHDFCGSFPVPFSLPRILPSDVPTLRAGDVENHESWNRPSLYYRNQDSKMDEAMELSAASEKSLEKALDLCTVTSNGREGLKEAAKVLARALENDRNSVILWIVYLHIFHRKKKVTGKDDMFSFAIRCNEASYELWLIFINSRMHLGDRLGAFDSALSTLCRLASTPSKVSKYSSACILDLFLQMIESLRMSGDLEKAVSIIFSVLPTAMNVNGSGSAWHADILKCLTICDQCVFWVSCVYLLMYKKLPEMVVQRFESEQDLLFGLEWPAIELMSDKKDQVIGMMNMAVEAMRMSVDNELGERYDCQETSLLSVHSLAVNHVNCVAALDDLEFVENLLVGYLKSYPTCIELVLTLARLRKDGLGEECYDGFEEALCNWPRDVSGIQCLWNQYAEYALENGSTSLAEELMLRWFESSWKVQNAELGRSDHGESDLKSSLSGDSTKACSNANSNSKDQLFGLLNLSLHWLLLKDQVQAHATIDKAMKLAAGEDLKHCVREHASFVLSGGPDLDASASTVLNILLGYLADSRLFPLSEPLSRRFEKSVHKPRLRKLINAIFCPVSLDCSLMNSILRDWYGPSLLPENFGKIKDLVDFVEGLVEILPANYQLALSACKLVTRSHSIFGAESASVIFWAACLLVNCIFQAFPVAPECYWVETADVLSNLDMDIVSERFHQQAITVYPFSIDLWTSYLNLAKKSGKADAIFDAAREWGIDLKRVQMQKEKQK